MSAAEIIDQIEKLPDDEFWKVEAYMNDVRLRELRDFFAWADSLPRRVEMTEEEILALPRRISPDDVRQRGGELEAVARRG